MARKEAVVVLVEDQPLVRWSLRIMLEREGYHVIEAAHAEEALTILQTRGDISDLVADLDMPGMGGADLAALVQREWPRVRVLCISGKPLTSELPAKVGFRGPRWFRASRDRREGWLRNVVL